MIFIITQTRKFKMLFCFQSVTFPWMKIASLYQILIIFLIIIIIIFLIIYHCHTTFTTITPSKRFAPHTLPLHSVFTEHNTHSHVGFYGGRKTGEPGEKPLWHRREQHSHHHHHQLPSTFSIIVIIIIIITIITI